MSSHVSCRENDVKPVYVGDTLVTSILEIIHNKCELIGRPGLIDVKAGDVKILSETSTGSRIIRLRGMLYQVDLTKETFGIFDPVLTSSSARKRTGNYRGYLACEK